MKWSLPAPRPPNATSSPNLRKTRLGTPRARPLTAQADGPGRSRRPAPETHPSRKPEVPTVRHPNALLCRIQRGGRSWSAPTSSPTPPTCATPGIRSRRSWPRPGSPVPACTGTCRPASRSQSPPRYHSLRGAVAWSGASSGCSCCVRIWSTVCRWRGRPPMLLCRSAPPADGWPPTAPVAPPPWSPRCVVIGAAPH